MFYFIKNVQELMFNRSALFKYNYNFWVWK